MAIFRTQAWKWYPYFNLQIATRLNGAALLLIARWSIRNNIALRNLKHELTLTRC
jgi:hypothetical protein